MEREQEIDVDRLTDYQPHMDWLAKNRGVLFPSPGSLQWFLRQHRKELVADEVVLVRRGPGGIWINARKFEAAALRILHRESKASV